MNILGLHPLGQNLPKFALLPHPLQLLVKSTAENILGQHPLGQNLHLLGQNVIGCLILSNPMQFSPKITAEVYLLYEMLTWELQAPIESLQEAALVLQGITPVKYLGIVVAW
ncbi:hypothetical protein DFH08DRAFT_816992 [Mycena albidolilacea]|uniref:Uncharacterized protein n=1 Tax=Mycena albidolilacea TaxID=1033008 RepID=A0AAD7EJ42_9AGAR|nr:hypothetical protein DFH08DRAFT_816992 [Mycena albidolilacea]